MSKQETALKVLHEIRDGLHRIVVIGEEQNYPGEWFPQSEVAKCSVGKFFAICGESVLPQGIFTVKEHSHQVLS